MKKIIAIVLILFSGSIGFAQTDLGKPFRPIGSTFSLTNLQMGDYSDVRSPFTNVDKIPINSNPQRVADLEIINNESDYARVFSLDVKVNGNYLFLKGNDEFHRYVEEHSHSQTTRIYFLASLIKGDQIFDRPILDTAARNLLSSDPDKFVNTYGDYYVSHSRLLKRILVAIDISNLDASTMQELNGLHQGNVDMAFWSVHSNIPLRQKISNAYKNNSCKIKVTIDGEVDNKLYSNLTQAVDLEKNNQNFDLLMSLADNFFKLLQNDDNAKHYYNEVLNVSNFKSLGMLSSYYDQLNRKTEKIVKYSQLSNEIWVIKQAFDQYTNPVYSWDKILPDTMTNKIVSNKKLCERLIDQIFDALKICKDNPCKTLVGCCDIPPFINEQVKLLTQSYQNIHRDYPHDPILARNFKVGVTQEYNASSFVNGLRTWNVKFDSHSVNSSSPYKNLKNGGIKAHAFFSCQIFSNASIVQNYVASGILIDLDNNKQINTSQLSALDIIPMAGDSTRFNIVGDFTFSNADDILTIEKIGFLLKIHEVNPDQNANHNKLVVLGGPDILLQGLDFRVE